MLLDIFYSFLIILIIVGIFFFINHYNKNKKDDCPDILIQKGKYIYLMNKYKKAIIKFNNLDEYQVYYKTQKQQGKKCPELYLQKEYNIQGDPVFINRKSPFEKEGGVPVISGYDFHNNNNKSLLIDSTRNHPPFNNNLYPGFDPMNQYVGIETPLDKMYNKNSTVPPILTTTKYEGFQFN
jgi:hypothetical protein